MRAKICSNEKTMTTPLSTSLRNKVFCYEINCFRTQKGFCWMQWFRPGSYLLLTELWFTFQEMAL